MEKPAPKLKEIAERIYAHLKRFEADPEIKKHGGKTRYFMVNAFASGARVGVVYVSLQGCSFLSKIEALAYLAWLDAGHVGKHYVMRREKPDGS